MQSNRRINSLHPSGEVGPVEFSASAPVDADVGYKTRQNRHLHLTVQCDGGTSFGLTPWFRSPYSGKWAMRRDFGTNGTLTVASAEGIHNLPPFEILGAEEVFFQIASLVGDPDATNVWAGANTFE